MGVFTCVENHKNITFQTFRHCILTEYFKYFFYLRNGFPSSSDNDIAIPVTIEKTTKIEKTWLRVIYNNDNDNNNKDMGLLYIILFSLLIINKICSHVKDIFFFLNCRE